MKVSKLALGLALAAGFGMAAPTIAKDKKENTEAAKFSPELSKGFRNAVQPFQKALSAKDYATAQSLLPAVQAAATAPDEKWYVGQFKIALGQGLKDQAMLQAGVVEALNSGSQGVEPDRGKFSWYAGQFAFQAKDYPAAVQYLTAAKTAGYHPQDANGLPDTNFEIMLAESYFQQKQIPQGMAVLDQAIKDEQAAGRKVPQSWYGRAASIAYQSKNMAEAAKWTRAQVAAYPTAENWRSALVIFGDSNHFDDQTQLDLLRLKRFAGALAGERDYYEYAVLADKIGLPGEAKAVVDEGKAKGAFDASSKAINEIGAAAGAKVAADKASLAASEKSAASAANGKAALGTADAYFGYGDYAKAATLYKLALQKGGVDAATVNMRLGEALAKSGQAAEAKQALSQVTGPRAELAQFWTLWVDQHAGAAG
jgi:lipopolysaccharide biosynthesis regulator YciM